MNMVFVFIAIAKKKVVYKFKFNKIIQGIDVKVYAFHFLLNI